MSNQNAKIKQMIAFIESEAKEKAKEIELETNEEFVKLKQNMVEKAKKSIREMYKRKEKQVETEKKILESTKIKQARLTVLERKEEELQKLRSQALEKLKTYASNEEQYKNLLHDLTLQGLFALMENKVSLLCRKADVSLLESQIKKIQESYKEKTKRDVNIQINSQHLDDDCAGGVIVCALGDRIKVDNTLEERLKLCYDQNIPVIRDILFPKSEFSF